MNKIMGDTKLEKKVHSIHVDDEFNKKVLMEAMERYKNMEVCL
jgi:hypothetical protein